MIVLSPGTFCSAVIEHTNRVIFLEDDDVAAVVDGRLSIHRIKRTAGDHPGRAVQTLQMELQQIMKGERFCPVTAQCPRWKGYILLSVLV